MDAWYAQRAVDIEFSVNLKRNGQETIKKGKSETTGDLSTNKHESEKDRYGDGLEPYFYTTESPQKYAS